MSAPAPATQSIAVEYDLPHPPEKVWRALTEPALVGEWLMPNDLKPVVGHKFTFAAPPIQDWDGVVQCEVLVADKPKRLSYSWRGGPSQSRLDSVVTWTLTPTPQGTHLAFEHAGFLPHNAVAFDRMGQGWRGKVREGLGRVIASLA